MFTNKDVKRFFIILSCLVGGFACLLQFMMWLFYDQFNLMLLLLSLFFALGILGSAIYYFYRQKQSIENAIFQINLFLTGDTNARIECDSEGSLYKLFHAVNTLATTLNAHAAKEQKTKEFMKNTISDISHQLKTPLAALSIYNGLLQDDSEDKAALKDFVLKSEREIDRIETLVQSLLKITKLDAGTIAIENSPENISDMMNDMRLNFEIRSKQEQKTITLSGPRDTELICDRNWILEAMSNIVKNALDHTETGSDIKVEWKRLPAVTQITIKDTGSGIHSEDIHHIFKRFYRSRFSKDTQGLGLGLALAKAIVEAHSGNITVDSVLGNGSVFVISFLNITKL